MFSIFDLIEAILARRFIIPFIISIGIAIGVYYLGGQTPAFAAIAFFIGLVGLCAGVVLHLARGRSGTT
ncbi:MAG: hypothetical protein EON58_15215 [Alphaproteobacteria bacterium]|nr:MAG: hypothetical protein EON58_15215 [Alphaproteobacteria bacterium]